MAEVDINMLEKEILIAENIAEAEQPAEDLPRAESLHDQEEKEDDGGDWKGNVGRRRKTERGREGRDEIGGKGNNRKQHREGLKKTKKVPRMEEEQGWHICKVQSSIPGERALMERGG